MNTSNFDLHPREALRENTQRMPFRLSCEHYAGTEKRLLKAFELQEEFGPIFDITADLEDGAPAGAEREHAERMISRLASERNKHKRAGLRIHDYQSPFWRDEVQMAVQALGADLSYLTIPKAHDAMEVETMLTFIRSAWQRVGQREELPVHVIIETHGALHEVWQIAQIPWVQVLDFGLMDFVSSHHGALSADCMRSPGQFEHRLLQRAKSEIVAAALANGIIPSHNVTIDYRSGEQTYQDARRAHLEFGFLRMWSVHPNQIRPIVEAMRPEFSEVERAGKILRQGQAAQWAPISFDGTLHDRASYRYYWDLLNRAYATGMDLGEDITSAFFVEA